MRYRASPRKRTENGKTLLAKRFLFVQTAIFFSLPEMHYSGSILRKEEWNQGGRVLPMDYGMMSVHYKCRKNIKGTSSLMENAFVMGDVCHPLTASSHNV